MLKGLMQLIDQSSNILTLCNVLFMHNLHDEELLDIQVLALGFDSDRVDY